MRCCSAEPSILPSYGATSTPWARLNIAVCSTETETALRSHYGACNSSIRSKDNSVSYRIPTMLSAIRSARASGRPESHVPPSWRSRTDLNSMPLSRASSKPAKPRTSAEITGDLSIPGNIMDQVWHGIRGSDIVIADITGGNPNVLFEMGLSAALGKEVIIVGEQEVLPFHVAHSRKITYSRAKLDELKQELVAALASISARYPFEGPEPRF